MRARSNRRMTQSSAMFSQNRVRARAYLQTLRRLIPTTKVKKLVHRQASQATKMTRPHVKERNQTHRRSALSNPRPAINR